MSIYEFLLQTSSEIRKAVCTRPQIYVMANPALNVSKSHFLSIAPLRTKDSAKSR